MMLFMILSDTTFKIHVPFDKFYSNLKLEWYFYCRFVFVPDLIHVHWNHIYAMYWVVVCIVT